MHMYSSNNNCYKENYEQEKEQMIVQGYFKCCYYPNTWCEDNKKEEKDCDNYYDKQQEHNKGCKCQQNTCFEKQENKCQKQHECNCHENGNRPCLKQNRNCCFFCNRRFF